MTGYRPPLQRHWRSYGNDPLPTPEEALDQPLAAFPSWFLRIICDRCSKDRMISEAPRHDDPRDTRQDAPRWLRRQGRAGGAAHRHRGRVVTPSAADRAAQRVSEVLAVFLIAFGVLALIAAAAAFKGAFLLAASVLLLAFGGVALFTNPFEDGDPISGRRNAAVATATLLLALYFAVRSYIEEPVLLRTLHVIGFICLVLCLVGPPPRTFVGLMNGSAYGLFIIVLVGGIIMTSSYILFGFGGIPGETPAAVNAIPPFVLSVMALVGCCIEFARRPQASSNVSRGKWAFVRFVPAIGSIVVAMCAVLNLLLRFWREITEIIQRLFP